MKHCAFVLISILLCLSYSCNPPVKLQQSVPEDFSEYYYRISHLPQDSMVWTANGILAPKYLKDLDFLDGYRIPTFSARDIQGNVQNVTYKGKLTLLNYWFIACPPCVEEIPLLNAMQDKYSGKLEVVSICRDAEADILEFMMEHPINYVVIPDARDIIDNRFKMVWGYPKKILIGTDGRVLEMTRGIIGLEDENYQKIEKQILQNSK